MQIIVNRVETRHLSRFAADKCTARITNKYDVYVAHGEYITSYANMGTICVEKGQKVARNAQIGTIGSAVNVMTMETEYKLVFGIYPPNPGQKMRAEECFRK